MGLFTSHEIAPAEIAGTFDLDSDLNIWVSGAASPLTVKISRQADPQAILRLLAERVLTR